MPEARVAAAVPSARVVWIMLALVALIVVVFEPVRNFGFLPFDDPHYVYQNPRVLAGLSMENLQWAFTYGSPYWHPLTWLSLMADVTLFGPSPGALHLVAVTIHGLSAVLLFSFFYRVTAAPWQSAFVAALFAVHPTRVESVVWIAERKDVLPALCMMVMLHAYVSYVRRPGPIRYTLVTIPLVLGLLAKPTLITLPFALLLLDLWPLGRLSGLSGVAGLFAPERRSAVIRLVVEKLPWIALALVAAAINFSLHVQPLGTLESVPLPLRLANALMYYVKYIAMALWPVALSPLHPVPRLMPAWWQLASALALLIGLSVWALRSVRVRPYITTGWFWFVATLVPAILLGLAAAGDQGVADRFGYIPFIGLFTILAWGVPDVATRSSASSRWSMLRPMIPGLALVAVVASTVLARQYVFMWRDATTLWTHAIAVDPSNHRAHANLGDALAIARQYPAAIAEFREAVRLAPHVFEYRRQIGSVFARNGQLTEALAEFDAVLAATPAQVETSADPDGRADRVRTLNEMGLTLARMGRHGEAVLRLSDAVRLDASSAMVRANLCLALAGAGRLDAGILECREAVRLDPQLADAHSNLGAVVFAKGDVAGAIGAFAEAARLDPLTAGRFLKLGAGLARQGRLEEARQAFTDAVRLDPRDAEAHNALGAILAELGKDREAIVEYGEALKLQPRLAHVYANRGRSLATIGDVTGAIQDYQQVLRIDPNNAGARSAIDLLQKMRAGR